MTKPEPGSTLRRMFVEGEWSDRHEAPRSALQRLMRELDNEAARNGMAVVGDVTVMASEPNIWSTPRTMRLEADVVTR